MPHEPTPGQPTPLQQLEAALAAGHLTPELFATLRAQLPAEPTAPPAPKATFSPSGPDEELPSLLDMFNKQPAAPVTPPPVVPAPPAARPAPASSPPLPPTAADAAARQLIEERLAQIRQRPAVEPVPPKPASAPVPAPTFYPEPAAPTYYPEPAAPNFYPTHPMVAAASPPPAQPTPPRPSAPPAEPTSGKAGRWLLVLLLGLAVAGALAYFFIQNSHPDETLTSPSLPAASAAPKEVAAPKPAKRSKKSTKKKRKKKVATPVVATKVSKTVLEDERNAVVDNEAPTTAVPPASEAPAPGSRRSPPAAPEAGDDAATIKVRTAMAAYYADLLAPPLHASQHFAPLVERLYLQQNLTPAAIDAELARSFYPENQQAIARIEPGTLRVSAPVADGSRTATFIETMRLYRVSLRKNQQLRTQVRVRFNADYQIVYMRQEKLLANTFE